MMNEYEKWVKDLNALNDRINNLGYWNDYAEMLQREYDNLLASEPKPRKG